MIKKSKIKKKKYKATPEAIASVSQKQYDPLTHVTNNFVKLHKNELMFHHIGSNLFIRVKVLFRTRPGMYDNILVKVIEEIDPIVLKNIYGMYFNKDVKSIEKSKLKKGKILFVNHLSLYTTEQAYKLNERYILQDTENLLVCRNMVKRHKEHIDILEKNKSVISKSLKKK